LSTLTKICVVLLVVIILPASAVFIKQATTIPNYKDQLEKQKLLTTLVNQHLTAKEGEVKSMKVALDTAQGDVVKVQGDKDRVITTLRTERDGLAVELVKAKSANEVLQIQAVESAKLASTSGDRTDKLLVAAAEARAINNKLSQDIVLVKDLNAEQRASLTRAEELVRLYREQNAETVVTLEKAQALIASYRKHVPNIDVIVKGGTGPNGPGTLGVNATILAVSEGIASINAGSARGVRAGMKLVVYRGGRLVGFLKIREVDAQEAAGVMYDSILTAQQGDKVTSQQALQNTTAGG